MSTTDPDFPEQLPDANERSHVVETFGLGPSLVAFALAMYGAFAFANSSRTRFNAIEYAVLALILLVVAGCVRHEIVRRRRRAVLVVADSHVGVYRQRGLCGVLTTQDLMANQAPQFGSIEGS